MRLLLVEEDPKTVASLCGVLCEEHFDVQSIRDGNDIVAMIEYFRPDLMILGDTIHDTNLIREVREADMRVPIVVLSSCTYMKTKIDMLDRGADDYIVKPWDGGELVARIRAVMRRSGGYASNTLTLGDVKIDLNTTMVEINGQYVCFTTMLYQVLSLLVRHPGQVIDREWLFSYIYGGDGPETGLKNIDGFIFRLRKKLKRAGSRVLLESVWGRGYVLRDSSKQYAAHLTRLPVRVAA